MSDMGISQQLACERRCRRCILSTVCNTRSASIIISPPRRSRPTTKQSRLRQPRCEAWATGLADLVDTRSTVLFLQWTEPRESTSRQAPLGEYVSGKTELGVALCYRVVHHPSPRWRSPPME